MSWGLADWTRAYHCAFLMRSQKTFKRVCLRYWGDVNACQVQKTCVPKNDTRSRSSWIILSTSIAETSTQMAAQSQQRPCFRAQRFHCGYKFGGQVSHTPCSCQQSASRPRAPERCSCGTPQTARWLRRRPADRRCWWLRQRCNSWMWPGM